MDNGTTIMDSTTPGGSLGNLENPPSAEAGPTDSGRGQPLFTDDPFRKSFATTRSPPKDTSTRESYHPDKQNANLRGQKAQVIQNLNRQRSYLFCGFAPSKQEVAFR